MNVKKTSNLYLVFSFLCFVTILTGQNMTIEYNSSATPEDPHLMLLEVGDDGTAGGDGWSRMWFKNDADLDNRWGFLARPQNGALDNPGVIASPLVMAYTGDQKFGFGKDGNLVINKSYVLPNSANAANAGQALVVTGNTVGTPSTTATTNWRYIDYTEKNSNPANATLQLHENSNDAAQLVFTNNQFTDNRFYINADPSNTTGVNASMRLGWRNTGTANDIITLDGSTNHVGIGVDPYDAFRLHVVGPEAAAHFGPQTTSFPAVGYVTVNKPASNASTSIFKVRDNGSQVADFDDNEISFYQPTTIREEVKIINGDLSLIGATPGTLFGADAEFTGTVMASCGLLSCSDVRYKKNITAIPSVLEKLDKISGVYYDWDTDNFSEMGFSNDRQVGVIAQELETVFPELVITKDDGYKVVAYDKLAPVVLQAVKEQQDIINELKAENTIIKNQIAEILAKI